MAGTLASVETGLRSNWNQAGRNRNQLYQDMVSSDELYAVPSGYYPSNTWILPQRLGGMVSHDNTVFSISTNAALIYGGVTATAPATIGIDATGTGSLVSTVQPGAAPATFGMTTNVPDLTASLIGGGTATFGMTGTAVLIANGLAVASTTFGLDGTLISHAIGIMSGTTAEAGVTVDNVVNGVWNATLADHLLAGSTGAALSAAGGAGDPWITTLPGAYAPGSAGDIIGNMLADMGARAVDGTYTQDQVMRLFAAVLAGKVSGAGTGTETFRGINDDKDRVVATVDSSGNRTAITLDGT